MYIRKYHDKDLRRDFYRFRVQIEKADYYGKGFESASDARDAVAALRTRLLKERFDLPVEPRGVTLSELVAERVAELDTDANKNHRRIKVVLEHFRDRVGPARLVASLEDSDMMDYRRARSAEFRRDNRRAISANTINRELEAVAVAFNRAGLYFKALKAWKHPRLPYEKTDSSGRERVIAEAEESALLSALRARRRPGRAATASAGPRAAEQVLAHRTRLVVADLWELAPHVGMRKDEMRRMEKTWVDWRERLVRLPKHATKTGRAREVPLNEVAYEILKRRCAESPHARYVFTNARGTNVLSEFQMYRALKKAAAAAGLRWGQRVEGGFTLHDNRHTFATRALHAGADLATVADVLGHSEETMTLRYSHSTIQSKRRAVESVIRKKEEGEEG